MAVNPVLSTGVSGIQYGIRGMDQAAHEIAAMNHRANLETGEGRVASPDDVGDAAEAVVSLQTYQRQVEASAKVVKTADAVIGMLIDTVV